MKTLLSNDLKILLPKVLESVSVGLSLEDLLTAFQSSPQTAKKRKSIKVTDIPNQPHSQRVNTEKKLW